jgi:signal peptidase II
MNNKQRKQTILAISLVAALIVIDQVVKIIVKTNMVMGEEFNVIGTWFRIHFTENEGFAFGTSFGGRAGKIALTVFRLLASGAIVWLLCRLLRKGTRTSLVVSLSLILAGAVGNLVDCLFYGRIFSESFYSVATLFPPEGGYAPFLEGRVVDMFYFPLFAFDWPAWLPFVGGQHFEFFNAIFNVADSAVTIGVIWLIVDQIFLEKKSPED